MIRGAHIACLALVIAFETSATLALSTRPALAQDLPPEQALLLQQVIDATCVDLDEARPGCEHAVLVANTSQPDRADLIVLSDRRSDAPAEPLLIARAIAFSGAAPDMMATVDRDEAGLLRLSSQQTGMGRFPWFQTLEIGYRENRFVLAGFAYRTFDREAGGVMTCDVDLLTGDYAVETTAVDVASESAIVVLADSGQIEALDLDLATLGTNTPFPAPCEAGLAALDGY